MILGAIYLLLSIITAGLCMLNAWEEHVHFYSMAVYLSTNKTAVLIMGNFSFALGLVFVKTFQAFFFGKLTDEESREISEKSKYAILETCLALTTFRLSLNITVVCLFTVLLFSKMFHWLASMRVDNSEQQRLPIVTLFRTGIPLVVLLCSDVLFILGLSYLILQSGKVDVLVLFSFEWTILMCSIIYHSFRFILATIEHIIGGQMRAKHTLLFFAEFCYKLMRLGLYVVFFVVVMVELGSIPLHLLREMFMNIVFLKGMIVRYAQYRNILKNIERFQTVNLAPDDERDSTCTVCMAEITDGKQLPCGHIFHLRCLKEWLRRNPICPTCRHSIRVPTQPAVNVNNNPPAEQQAANMGPVANVDQPQQQGGGNQPRRGRNVIILPVVQGGQQRQGAGEPGTEQENQTNQPITGAQSIRFVLPSPASNPAQGIKSLENYTLAVQREAEVHEMYLGHLYSLQHQLLLMQQRWKTEEEEQKSRKKEKSRRLKKENKTKRAAEKGKCETSSNIEKAPTTLPPPNPRAPISEEKTEKDNKEISITNSYNEKNPKHEKLLTGENDSLKVSKKVDHTLKEPVDTPKEPIPVEIKKASDRTSVIREKRLQKLMMEKKPKTPCDEDSMAKRDE